MRTLFFIITIFLFSQSKSQTEKIKIKKAYDRIYFFQKGEKADTISRGKSDLFYLFIPDTLKPFTGIFIENGALQKTKNDSLFTLIYVPGIKYECAYQKFSENSTKAFSEFRCLINGTSNEAQPIIRVVLRIKDKTEIENKFFYQK